MAEEKDFKSPAQEYMHDIQVIDIFLVNKIFLGYLDTKLVGMNCHT